MEAKVAPPPALDTSRNWSSNCSTPYISAPSSPQRPINLFFYSAPPSPRSSSSSFFAGEGDHISLLSDEAPPSPSAFVPFDWESKPGVPKSSSSAYHNRENLNNDNDDDDFEFDFSGQLDRMIRPSLSSADELFDAGKIRPLKPPPVKISGDPPKSPKSKCRAVLSPKQRKKNSPEDPFEAALQTSRKSEPGIPLSPKPPRFNDQNRGRSKNPNTKNPRGNSRKGISRSLSPLRVSEFALSQNESLNGSSSKSGKKWRLKDFLLFRSASDGRAAITGSGKDPLKKFFSMGMGKTKKDHHEASFRSTTTTSSMAAEGSGSGSGSVSRRRGRLSAHELHYTANRAVSEEMKKKTSLPYKHGGILGCLGFNPALQKAFGAFASSSSSSSSTKP